jgi:hypothetical protein
MAARPAGLADPGLDPLAQDLALELGAERRHYSYGPAHGCCHVERGG